MIGFIFGYIFAKYLDTAPGSSKLMIFYTGFLCVCLGLFLQTMIHELGHLIFGLMTGYSYVSYRVGSLTLVRQDGKFKLKKYDIPGTLGQCLMMPPEIKDGKFPFVLYNLGGSILNFLVSILCILILIYSDTVDYPMNMFLLMFIFIGIFLGLTNIVPLKIGGISNDGNNVLLIKREEEARRSFYIQLRINGLQSEGIRIKDMPFETFILEDDKDLSNYFNTAMVLLQYNWYLDHLDFDNAKKTLDRLVPYLNKTILLYKYEINCERIFLELITDGDKKLVDRLYSKELKKFIKKANKMISKLRFLLAYELLYNEDQDEALKYYDKMKRLAKQYSIKAEADMEMMLADYVMDIKKTQ